MQRARGAEYQVNGFPWLLWRAHGNQALVSRVTHCCPMLPSPTTPSRSLVLPLLVPGHVQQKTQERHQPYLGPVFSASCQERGHRWLCPREGDLSCAPFSRQTQGDVPCVWPASPGPAAQSFCHKSTAPPVLRPAATSQQANFTSTLSPVVFPA